MECDRENCKKEDIRKDKEQDMDMEENQNRYRKIGRWRKHYESMKGFRKRIKKYRIVSKCSHVQRTRGNVRNYMGDCGRSFFNCTIWAG